MQLMDKPCIFFLSGWSSGSFSKIVTSAYPGFPALLTFWI
jgi:hypothetical protein